MRQKEQRLWDGLKRNAPKEFWLQRVENVVANGMPDVYVACVNPCWVELKAPNMPKRKATRILGKSQGLNPDQINWHLKAAQKGIRSFVLIRGDGNDLYLIPGSFAAMINDMTQAELLKTSVGNNWHEIFEVIK